MIVNVTVPVEMCFPGNEIYLDFDSYADIPKEFAQRHRGGRLAIAENIDGERWSASLRKITCRHKRLRYKMTIRERIAEIEMPKIMRIDITEAILKAQEDLLTGDSCQK